MSESRKFYSRRSIERTYFPGLYKCELADKLGLSYDFAMKQDIETLEKWLRYERRED